MLCERPESAAEIARQVGATRGSVSSWRLGDKVPSAPVRTRVEQALGIPSSSWGETDEDEPAVPVNLDESDEPANALAGIDDLLRAVRRITRNPRLLASERIRAGAEERALLAMRARVENQIVLGEQVLEATIVRHPRWQSLKWAIIEAVMPFKEAREAVHAAILANLPSDELTKELP